MGRPDSWMPLYVADYLRDTMHLTTEQHGAYILLLLAYWVRGKALPDNDSVLRSITGLEESSWESSKSLLAEFFDVRDNQWHHARVETELSEANRIYDAKKRGGQNSAKSRPKTPHKTPTKTLPKTPTQDSHPTYNTPPYGGGCAPNPTGGTPPLLAFAPNPEPLMTKEELNAIRQHKFDAEAAAFAATQRTVAPD